MALSFLTILPAGVGSFQDKDELVRAAHYFPAVGAMLGLLFVGMAFPARLIMDSGSLVVLVFAVSFVITRGLHIDGLADTADGFAGGADREHVLRIMKDSAIGPAGVCLILLFYLFKFAALSALDSDRLILMLFMLPVVSRWNIVLAGAAHPSARHEGLGNCFINTLKWRHFAGASLMGVAIVSAAVYFTAAHFQSNFLLFPVLTGLGISFAASSILAVAFARCLGGLTGDTLGAINESAEIFFIIGAMLWWGASALI